MTVFCSSRAGEFTGTDRGARQCSEAVDDDAAISLPGRRSIAHAQQGWGP
jgi:hypothetical protein